MNIVTVFGANHCLPCKNTKRWLDQNGVDYDYVDVTQVPEALEFISDIGYSGIPVVTVEKSEGVGSADFDHWNGFNLGKLKELLA